MVDITHASVRWDAPQPGDFRVVTMRYWPRGLSIIKQDLHAWVPDAGPSGELLRQWQQRQITWEMFAVAYVAEQGRRRQTEVSYYPRNAGRAEGYRCDQRRWELAPIDALITMAQALEGHAAYRRIVVLCHENLSQTGEHCHRVILTHLLRSRYEWVAEQQQNASAATFAAWWVARAGEAVAW